MLLSAPTQVGCWTNAGDAHLAHVPLHRFAIDRPSVPAQFDGDAPRTIERIGRVDRINAMFERHLLGGGCHRLVVETRATETQEFGLAAERQFPRGADRKSTRLNSSHANISYAVFCLKKKKK